MVLSSLTVRAGLRCDCRCAHAFSYSFWRRLGMLWHHSDRVRRIVQQNELVDGLVRFVWFHGVRLRPLEFDSNTQLGGSLSSHSLIAIMNYLEPIISILFHNSNTHSNFHQKKENTIWFRAKFGGEAIDYMLPHLFANDATGLHFLVNRRHILRSHITLLGPSFNKFRKTLVGCIELIGHYAKFYQSGCEELFYH